jgi:NAD(P)-dependent dehydrogenase (short-subunit alcohol dehydrogenase family)
VKLAPKKAIVISASSDIGIALTKYLKTHDYQIAGTYRTLSAEVKGLAAQQIQLYQCDLTKNVSVQQACRSLVDAVGSWDIILLCSGNLNPIGPFCETAFDLWSESVTINFINQLRILHYLLPFRNMKSPLGPCAIFFAGGGSNSAPANYSAYTISKIALTKMCELLDAEITDTRFAIIGPGWVKTKIHNATLKAGTLAGANLEKTKQKYASDEWTSMESVIQCCGWVIGSPREVVGGRNFSVVYDKWGTEELQDMLIKDKDLYKLRRNGNNRITRERESL